MQYQTLTIDAAYKDGKYIFPNDEVRYPAIIVTDKAIVLTSRSEKPTVLICNIMSFA